MIAWNKRFSSLYYASVFITLVFILLGKKPFFVGFDLTVLPILIFALLFQFKKNHSVLMPLTIVATTFSFLGDVLMLMDIERTLFKTLGICTFVAAQVSYGLLYIQSVKASPDKSALPWKQRFPEMVLAVILIGYTYQILSRTQELFVPSLIYAIFADTVFFLALHRRFYVSKASFLSVFSGAFLFIMSASLTALDFYSTNPYLHALSILFYATAHYLVTNGILIQIQDTASKKPVGETLAQ